MYKDYLDYICCQDCKNDLVPKDGFLVCEKCKKQYELIGNIFKTSSHESFDVKLSIDKWDKLYTKNLENDFFQKELDVYLKDYFQDTYQQLIEYKNIGPDSTYLEIGCGQMFLGQELASKCKLVIGIDFSPVALTIAKKCLIAGALKIIY
jgi:2-polyprenyl-3-methyl-5-hydroxy-6-metoxy-1,4-benzoquinol methylase